MQRVIVFMCLAGCGGSAGLGGTTSQTNPASTGAAVLQLTPTTGVSFGAVAEGSTATAQIHIVNSGEQRATSMIDASSLTSGFSYAGGNYPGTGGDCSDLLNPSGGCTLVVAFSPPQIGSLSATISLSYNDGKTTQTVTMAMSGTGQEQTGSFGVSGVTGAGLNKMVDSFGPFVTGSSGSTQTITAIKGPNDDALFIITLNADLAPLIAVDLLTSPSGALLASLNDFDNLGEPVPGQELNRSYPDNGSQAVTVPQTPDIAALTGPGPYTFVITAIDDNGYGLPNESVDVYVVHIPKASATPHIDVNLFFSGSAGMSAATAQTNSGFQAIVTEFITLYGGQGPGTPCTGGFPATSLGVCIDNIRYFDLPSGFSELAGDTSETTVGTKDMTELFEQSGGQPSGINFFFIQEITLDGLNSNGLLGLDGSIPSPGALNGTPRSGAIIILDSIPTTLAEQQEVGSTMAHEGGHYLGLFHNQEQDCGADNLSDTPCDPTCTCGRHASGCEDVSACVASTFDTMTLVMFWGADPDYPQTLFSPEQIATTHRHPLVH